MPWALTEIEPPTEKMSVDCMAFTAKRGCNWFWISCQTAPGCTVMVRASGVDLDLVELAHVEHQRIVVEGVAAHRMADRGDRDLQPVGAGERQRLRDMRLFADLDDAIDRRRRQRAGVVDRAGLGQPWQRRIVGRRLLQRLQRQRLAVDVGDAAGALRPGRIAGQPRQRRSAPQHAAADQRRAEQQPPRNPEPLAPLRHCLTLPRHPRA